MTTPFDRRTLLVSSLLLASSVAARASRLNISAAITPVDLEAAIPSRIGDWHIIPQSAAVLPDPDQEKAATAAYEQVLSRSYVTKSGEFVMLVIAHARSDSGLLAIHRAETCYTAQGFTVRDMGAVALPQPFQMVEPKRLFAVKDSRNEPVVYWATVAGERSDTGIAQKIRLLKSAWDGRAMDSFLIRASTIGTNSPASFAVVETFLAEMLASVSGRMQSMLGGIGAI
jgi:EpsI family protein